MEWSSGRTQSQLTCVTGAGQYKLNYLVYLQGCYVPAQALCASMAGNANRHASISKHGTAASSSSGALVLQSQILIQKARAQLWDCLYGQKCHGRNYFSISVSLLQSSCMHLNPWSLLCLITLVATFLNRYCSQSLGPKVLTADIMILDKEECLQQWTCSCSLCCEIRALDTQQLAYP